MDIAIIQSTHGREGVKDFVAEYGHVIVDECHHLSAFTFEQVMKQVKARYILGLTATPERKDGHHPIIYMQCGPIRHKLNARLMIQQLLAVNQYEGIHLSRRDQPCSHCGLAESSRCAEDPFVVFSHHRNSVLLRWAQLAAKLHVN